MQDVFIVSGARTPIGSFLGSLASISAPELGSIAIRGALSRGNVPKEAVEEVIMGCVLSAGIGQAPARQAMRKAGLPDSTGALTINKVCGSGMKAVMLAANTIKAGESDLIVAGGMESMSQAPHYVKGLRTGIKMGEQAMQDGMILDGLWDPYSNIHMGQCAERCVEHYQFTRDAQDEYARRSYALARTAVENGTFQPEIEPVSIPQRKGEPVVVEHDEEPFKGNPVKLDGLRPAFETGGSITAGNASSLNDGAAALVLASAEAVSRHQLKPLAKIIGSATFSQDPLWFTTAPVGAIKKGLEKTGLTIDAMDLIELNEAFAAVILAAQQELAIPDAKLNIHGGAIALGHPIGASGARVLVTLLHALKTQDKKYGLAALCIGGGEATAMIIEKI